MAYSAIPIIGGGGGSDGRRILNTWTVPSGHGFAAGNVVVYTGGVTGFALGLADDLVTSQTVGVVEAASTESITVVYQGEIDFEGAALDIDDGATSLTAGNVYFLSATTAGFLSASYPAATPNNITKALGYDKRISPLYIKSGLPFGGTCFPRDTWAFIKMSENIGLDAVHIKATQKINEQQNQFLLEKLLIFKDKKIGILGLSFKPNTSVTTESSGNFLYEYLKNNNYKVYGCDELVTTDFNYSNISEFIDKCEVIVITHDNKKILSEVMDKLKTKIVINPWNIEI